MRTAAALLRFAPLAHLHYYRRDAAVCRDPGAALHPAARELEHSRQARQCDAGPVPARPGGGCDSRPRGRAAGGVAQRGAAAAHLAPGAGRRGVPGRVLPRPDPGLSRRRPEPGLSAGTRPAGPAGGIIRRGARPASGHGRLERSAVGSRRLSAGGAARGTTAHRCPRAPDAAGRRESAGDGRRLGRARRARHGRLYGSSTSLPPMPSPRPAAGEPLPRSVTVSGNSPSARRASCR